MTTDRPSALVPRLRFPEFRGAGEWDRKRLGDVLKVGYGRDYRHLAKGDVPVYGTGGYMVSVDAHLYDGESVCIGRKGTIDSPMLLEGRFWTTDTLFYTHSFGDCLPRFMYLVFQRIPWQNYNAASGVPSLSKTTIEEIVAGLPELAEQSKIADCLGSLDDLIAAEGRKLDALQQHKQGLMQQLFPQPGETVPLLRFPEFRDAGEWEKKKIGDLSEVKASGDLDEACFSKFQSTTHLYPVYSNAVENAGLYGYYSLPQYKKNSVTITARGTLGVAFLRNHEFMGIGRLIVVSDLRNLDPCFLKECWNHLAVIPREVTSIPQLTAIAVRATVLPIPRPAEQQRIADCLSSLAARLAAQVQKINALKTHKQGLLQQLFPSLERQ